VHTNLANIQFTGIVYTLSSVDVVQVKGDMQRDIELHPM